MRDHRELALSCFLPLLLRCSNVAKCPIWGCLLKAIAPLILVLVLSAQTAAAQSDGAVRLPPVTGEVESPPIIQFVTYRLYSPGADGSEWEFVVDIHFVAPEGNATAYHGQIIRAPCCYRLGNIPINIPADLQKSGANFSLHLHIGRCDGSSSALSESYIADAKGNHGNSVRFTTHCRGRSLPYFDQQVQTGPNKYVDMAVPHTGTEAALRSYIEGWEKGEPPTDIMSPSVVRDTQAQSASIKKQIDDWGALKSIAFKSVDERDFDTYLVTFEHGESIWLIPQLTADGKLGGLSIRPSVADSPPAAHNEQSSPAPAQ